MILQRRNIVLSTLAALCGANYLPHARHAAAIFNPGHPLFEKADDDKGGGAPAITTLTDAKTRIGVLEGEATTSAQSIKDLTAERDQAKADLGTAKTRIGVLEGEATASAQSIKDLTTERDQAKADLGTANSRIGAVEGERESAKTSLKNLESYCGVMGVDIKNIPSISETPNPAAGKLTAQSFEDRLKGAKTPADRKAITDEFQKAVAEGRI